MATYVRMDAQPLRALALRRAADYRQQRNGGCCSIGCCALTGLFVLIGSVLQLQQDRPPQQPVAVYSAAGPLSALDGKRQGEPAAGTPVSTPVPLLSNITARKAQRAAAQRNVVPAAIERLPSPAAASAHSDLYARTNGPYYGDLHRDGELQRAIKLVSRGGEIVLLHGDAGRLRMLVNLVANLNELHIFHILLLGFSDSICNVLRSEQRGRMAGGHSRSCFVVHARAIACLPRPPSPCRVRFPTRVRFPYMPATGAAR